MADVPQVDIVAGIPTGGTGTVQTLSTTNTVIGAVNEAAPANDTASSGLNGRAQRIAQRLTSLITALGSPFQAGGSIGNTSFGATQATASNLKAQVVAATLTALQSAPGQTLNRPELVRKVGEVLGQDVMSAHPTLLATTILREDFHTGQAWTKNGSTYSISA